MPAEGSGPGTGNSVGGGISVGRMCVGMEWTGCSLVGVGSSVVSGMRSEAVGVGMKEVVEVKVDPRVVLVNEGVCVSGMCSMCRGVGSWGSSVGRESGMPSVGVALKRDVSV